MRVGVEGFDAGRFRDALSIRDRTGKDFAATLGISEMTVSRYLNGTSKPEPLVFVRMANELQLPESYFIRPSVGHEGSPVFYRSLAAATKRARGKAEVRNRWLRESWAYVNQYVSFPTVSIPEFDLPPDPAAISSEEIETIAAKVRRAWGLDAGPISNMVALLEAHGAVVSRVNLGAPKLDAFSQWGVPEYRPFVVLNGDKATAVRSRWDAAHELGHMVIHRAVSPTLLRRPEIHKLAEQQAHRFAGAFLLPADSFGRSVYVPALSSLLVQKRIWRVSIAAMLYRMKSLKLISEDHATRVWQSYSRSGMRLREPMDDELQPEQPEVLRRSFEMVMAERNLSVQQLLEVLPFDIFELQSLLGMPLGFSRNDAPMLSLRSDSKAIQEPGPEGTQVIPFRRMRSH